MLVGTGFQVLFHSPPGVLFTFPSQYYTLSVMDCKEILEMMRLPDYNAWEIVKRTNACLMEDPFWLRFSEDETFEDTTRGRARKIMAEYQKSADTN